MEGLMEAFLEAMDGEALSTLDIMQGVLAFVGKSTDLLTETGIVPPNYEEYLRKNLFLDFERRRLVSLHGDAGYAILKELAGQDLSGTAGQN